MNNIDGEYYENIKRKSIGERLLVHARNSMFEDMSRHFHWTVNTKVLDFGVSDTITDGANMLERLYPYPDKIVAVGLGKGESFKDAFPEVTYLQIKPFHRLPFEDGQFDFATSNAVFEHMGSLENQRWMLSELGRVSQCVYVTAPNRYFPVEHHTALPLLHYFDFAFRLGCRLSGQEKWAQPENLILTDRKYLSYAADAEDNVRVGYTGIKMGFFSSNLYLKYGVF